MKFLDTSFLIDIRLKNPNIEPIILELDEEGMNGVPSIVAHEFLFGGFNASNTDELLYRKAILSQFEIVPFNGRAAEYSAELESDLTKKGKMIGRADVMIAATVLVNGSKYLYTRNRNHFEEFEELELISWERMT